MYTNIQNKTLDKWDRSMYTGTQTFYAMDGTFITRVTSVNPDYAAHPWHIVLEFAGWSGPTVGLSNVSPIYGVKGRKSYRDIQNWVFWYWIF